jgi:hypothetical protein
VEAASPSFEVESPETRYMRCASQGARNRAGYAFSRVVHNMIWFFLQAPEIAAPLQSARCAHDDPCLQSIMDGCRAPRFRHFCKVRGPHHLPSISHQPNHHPAPPACNLFLDGP